MVLNSHMTAALVTLVTKYIRLQSPLKQKDFVAFELQVCVRRRLGEEVKATLCVFAQQCVQPASESASGQAKGRTTHQRIHRTTECFLGGGWDSEREGSKKSLGNYLQLWACFCAISHTIFYYGSGCNCECCRIISATVTWQWFELLQIVNCEGQNRCQHVLRRLSGVREAEATWAKARVIGSQFLNPDPACSPCLTSLSKGCKIAA